MVNGILWLNESTGFTRIGYINPIFHPLPEIYTFQFPVSK
jgi:hypothetical protein